LAPTEGWIICSKCHNYTQSSQWMWLSTSAAKACLEILKIFGIFIVIIFH
jgi:hypothetical protein